MKNIKPSKIFHNKKNGARINPKYAIIKVFCNFHVNCYKIPIHLIRLTNIPNYFFTFFISKFAFYFVIINSSIKSFLFYFAYYLLYRDNDTSNSSSQEPSLYVYFFHRLYKHKKAKFHRK